MTANDDKAALPRSVLFVCNQNSIRSPMAKALMDKHTSRRVFADSVGLITGMVDPFTAAVVHEAGGSRLDDHQPRTLMDVDLSDYDLIISLSAAAYDRLKSLLGDDAEGLEYWQTSNPVEKDGTRDQILLAYRLVRDQIDERIKERFPL